MNREEAIHILENLKPTNTNSSFDAYVIGEALTMAISALEKNDSVIEDIKQEIAKIEIPKDVKTVDGSFAFCQALEIADLAIDRAVDKHISRKER